MTNSEHSPDSSEHSRDSSEHSRDSSEHLSDSSEHLSDSSEHLPDGSEHLSDNRYQQLLQIAAPIRTSGKKKVSKAEVMEDIILNLCQSDWLTLSILAQLLDRHPDTIRTHYINRMLKDGRLKAKFPGKPHHPGQAYRQKDSK